AVEGDETGMKRPSLDATRRALEPGLRRVLHTYWRFARAMTLGVRALVIDEEGRGFLVKNSYGRGGGPARGGGGGGRRGGGSAAGGGGGGREMSKGWGRRSSTACSSTIAIRGAIMSRSSSCGRSVRRPRRFRTMRSSRTGSSPSMRCPTTPPPQRARASSRCSAARRSASDGEWGRRDVL